MQTWWWSIDLTYPQTITRDIQGLRLADVTRETSQPRLPAWRRIGAATLISFGTLLTRQGEQLAQIEGRAIPHTR